MRKQTPISPNAENGIRSFVRVLNFISLRDFLQNNQRKSHDLSELDLDRHTTRL